MPRRLIAMSVIQVSVVAHLVERDCNIVGISWVRISTKLSLKDAAILAILQVGTRSGVSSGWT